MDITRNWRLKMTRTHLLAARDPKTGDVILPQQGFASHDAQAVEVYTFETAPTMALREDDVYARAAR